MKGIRCQWEIIVWFMASIPLVMQGQVSKTSLTDSFDYYEIRRRLDPSVIDTIDQGLRWLEIQQGTDGLFHNQVGITALVVAAFLKHPDQKYTLNTHPFLQKSVDALTRYANLDGSICDNTLMEMAHPSYTTSVCLLALSATNNRGYYREIRDGRFFLKSLQMVDNTNQYFGGISYSSDNPENYDLSNLSLALLALSETRRYMREVMQETLPDDSSFLNNAIMFISRCQSNKINESHWETNLGSHHHGGFVYSPNGESKTQTKGKPYGSMTAAGLLSFIRTGLNSDVRKPSVEIEIEKAFKWICNNFQVYRNPGMNDNQRAKGLYYYYYTLALALASYEEIRTTPKGRIITGPGQPTIFWFQKLAKALVAQKIVNSVVVTQNIPNPVDPNKPIFHTGDNVDLAYWRNSNSGWMERDTVLTTAYAILALEAGIGTD